MKNTTNMTEGNILKNLIFFAVPILIGNIFQQLYNVADTAIIGNILGDTVIRIQDSIHCLCGRPC